MQDDFKKISEKISKALKEHTLKAVLAYASKKQNINLENSSGFNETKFIDSLQILNESSTPIEEGSALSKDFEFQIKREDQRGCGSHKYHGARCQIAYLIGQNISGGVISSSGNAGIALAEFGKKVGQPIAVFISPETDKGKIKALEKTGQNIFVTPNAQRDASKYCILNKFKNLRPSHDQIAKVGFYSLGAEIATQTANLDIEDIVIFSTSGASALGIVEFYQILKDEKIIKKIPKIHLVKGDAGSLGAKKSPLSNKLNDAKKTTEILCPTINISDIPEAIRKIQLSNESLSSIAYAYKNLNKKSTLVISTGKLWT